MAELMKKLMGRDLDKERKVKEEADAFAKKQAEATGEVAQTEKGLEDASVLGFLDPMEAAPEHYKGVGMAMMPLGGPEGGAPKKPGNFIARLREMGFPDSKIEKAADEMRYAGTHTFMDNHGNPVMTIGQSSPAGQELKYFGQTQQKLKQVPKPGAK